MSLYYNKKELRGRIKALLLAQAPADRARRSAAIGEKLFGLEAFRNASCVCFFAALPHEVDTAPMIDRALAAGKKVLLPLTDLKEKQLHFYEIRDRRGDLKPGTLGIPEPVPAKTRLAGEAEADCVVVPGVAFDRERRRVGHGAGLYDRFLVVQKKGTPKIGLAFSFQVVDQVPAEPHDVPVDHLLTD